jgi:hypothetical protein
MKDWAEREVEIACARERKNSTKEGEWDYGCACYESALKAFNSLMEDDHTGFSIGLTKQILVRLIEGKPLTPIEDTDDIWNEVTNYSDNKKGYREFQCKRMSSLFKRVHADETVKYSDVNGSYCVNINNPNITYHNGFVRRIIDEMFPIVMPYCPDKPIQVYCEEFLSDWKNGDFDTLGVMYAVKPDGERVNIYRYFKESSDGWDEITATEYADRKRMSVEKTRVSD